MLFKINIKSNKYEIKKRHFNILQIYIYKINRLTIFKNAKLNSLKVLETFFIFYTIEPITANIIMII